MKKVVFANPNKMLMESGHKTFDRQTNLVTTGNVIASTQYSGYIRPYEETECNGRTVRKGELQNFDLRPFGRLPYHVEKEVRAYAKEKSVILYMFFHYNGSGNKIIHGYVITDTDHQLIESYVTGPTHKSMNVIEECKQYVAVAA